MTIDDDTILQWVREVGAEHPDVTLAEFSRRTGVSASRIQRRFGSWAALREAAGLTPRPAARRRAPSAEEIRERLAEVVAETGPDITQREFHERTGITPTTIAARFGTWRALRESAGLPPRAAVRLRTLSAEAILERLREVVAETGPDLTQREFAARAGVSPDTIAARFGSWTALRTRAGLEPPSRDQSRITTEWIVQNLHIAHADIGDYLTQVAFCRWSGVSPSLIHRRFGGWQKLLRHAGIELKPVMPAPRISDEQLLAEFERLKRGLKRTPTTRDLELWSFYSPSTFKRRFRKMRVRRRAKEEVARRAALRESEGDEPGGKVAATGGDGTRVPPPHRQNR